MSTLPFNPLDTDSIAKSIVAELLRQPVTTLAKCSDVNGAGIYAIYYSGSFSAYESIRNNNLGDRFLLPIYVGKAIPEGSRKGGLHKKNLSEKALAKRLMNHLQTIEEVRNLEVCDFHFRALPLIEMWVAIGENGLIEQYQPLWNRILDGFGNKTPGKGRASQQRSSWDTIHPGRKYVDDLNLPAHSLDEATLLARVHTFLDAQSQKNISSYNEPLPLVEQRIEIVD